jgi:predicted XRE-type DNA-binding protein
LAAQVIKVLDAEKLSTRQAEARTGVAHSEFVRIRNVNLARFTIDRLVTILGRLGQEVEFTFTVHPRTRRETEPDTIAVARYLAAHFPTERALLQTADIASRLMRGGELHREAQAVG